jgi:hypothetical protein
LQEREPYVRELLEAYRVTPSTCGRVRRADRLLADQLYERGVPLFVVHNALALGAVRRLTRPPDDPPLAPVRSLAYFVTVIDEILAVHPDPDYFLYIRSKLQRLLAER